VICGPCGRISTRECVMPSFGVRTSSLVLAVSAAAACSDATHPSPITAPTSIDRAVNSLPLANATVHEIPALVNTIVNGINDSDQVSGDSGRPFRWTPANGIHYLTTAGTGGAAATSISNNGTVAGRAVVGDSNYLHAVAWLPNGTLRVFQLRADSLNIPPSAEGPACTATSINVYGQIVGTCSIRVPFETPEEFEWHGPAISPPGVPENDAVNAISDDGWIGGDEGPNLTGTSGPFVASPSGQTIFLKNHDGQLAGQDPAFVNAVARHGWAAGIDYEGGCGQAVAWLFHPGQSWPEFRMGTCGSANGITADWYVVGTGTDVNGDLSSRFAFVWFPGVGLQRLPGLGGSGETSQAYAVNANHHVLGQITDGTTVHTVIWYVGPRPTTVASTSETVTP
jgi:hypothetical protein